jgi:hypothetical protein
MARSRRKHGGPRRGTFKRKKLGKGYTENNRETQGSRPVLRITEAESADAKPAAGKPVAAKSAKG